MANQSHLDVLKQGPQEWNEWRAEHPEVRHPDLSGADLEGASLRYARLRRANLSGANLRKADLQNIDLFETNLRRANLEEADLRQAKMRKAYLEEAYLFKARLLRANLSRAHLQKADLREAELRQANLTDARLDRAELEGANLNAAILVETNLESANLTGSSVYGVAAWNVKLEGAKQHNLKVGAYGEPAVMVNDLEVAQFIYLLLNHRKLRKVLNAITERGVLILGRFGGGGLEVLEAIAAELRRLKYQPIIFDFERPARHNYTETVKTLVGLSRFVIVDLSGPSVPQELYATVPFFKIPFVPILEEGRRKYSIADDILEYPWVVDPPVRFADVKHLIRAMPTQIIAPAENWVKDREDRLADLFGA